jgi:alpha-D-ribose 1-methylphosphonate 5-triphosphate diphosphatase
MKRAETIWLSNLRLVLPDRTLDHGSLRIEGERIAEIVEGPAPQRADGVVINGKGFTALPGIIDMHGDMIENEIRPRLEASFPMELGVYELDKRLAANGVTTAYAAVAFIEYDTPGSIRTSEHARQIVTTIHQLRDSLLIDLLVHARYEITTPIIAPTLYELLSSGEIHLLSLMDHTPGQGQYRDIEKHIDAVVRRRKVHRSEVEEEFQDRIRHSKDPAIWRAARELVELAIDTGLPIASHDDDSPDKVVAMAEIGATLSEFPVAMDAAQEAQRLGMHVVMGAPNVLRGGSHSGNLSALDAIESGIVDILAADYAPAALLQSVFIVVRRGILPLHEATKLVSANPAEALALEDRGSLASGKCADLILVEEGAFSRVRATFRRGTPIYWDGAVRWERG